MRNTRHAHCGLASLQTKDSQLATKTLEKSILIDEQAVNFEHTLYTFDHLFSRLTPTVVIRVRLKSVLLCQTWLGRHF